MDRATFTKLSTVALEHIEETLADLEHQDLDVQLAGDVLTIGFSDGARYVINAHSAAGQIWMAADKHAWHFDYLPDDKCWRAAKTGDELMQTVARLVGERLRVSIEL